jgi:hypothetical protein
VNYGAFNSFGCDAAPQSGDNTMLRDGVSNSAGLLGTLLITAVLSTGAASASSINPKDAYDYYFDGGVSSNTNAYGHVAALISGGVSSSTSIVDSGIGIRQGGGLWSDSEAGSNVWRFSVTGGIESNDEVDGKWFLPLTLYSGVTSLATIGGILDWQSGLYGGVENSAQTDATQYIDCLMNSGVLNQHVVGGQLCVVPYLTGGVHTEDAVNASIMGGLTVLGGVASDDKADAATLKSGRIMVGGVDSLSAVASDVRVGIVLNPTEVPSLDSIGGQVRADQLFQGGIVSVGEPYANMVLTAELDGGINNVGVCNSELVSSATLLGGTDSLSVVESLTRKWATLSYGVTSASVVDSMPLRSNVFLIEGADSTGFIHATADLSAVVFGGYSQDCRVGAGQVIGCAMNGGLASTSFTNYSWHLSPVLNNGVGSTDAADASSVIQNIFAGGVSSSASTWTQLVVSQTLTGGLEDSYSFNDAEIASYSGDMLHNNGALEISSATVFLEIETPEGDS